MIRALIADDEPPSRRAVQQMLARHDDVCVVAECGDGEAVREAIDAHRPDVLFLDIRMPVASGLEIVRSTETRVRPLVVFVTAYDEFALPAFDVEAVDYLTKPLVEHRFDVALRRVRERLAGRRVYAAHLTTRVGARDVVIPLESVDHVAADDVYAAVVAGGRRHLVRASLDALERLLDPTLFVRVHRSYIVRVDRIREVRRDAAGNAEVITAGGAAVPVSRRRRAALDAIRRPLAT